VDIAWILHPDASFYPFLSIFFLISSRLAMKYLFRPYC